MEVKSVTVEERTHWDEPTKQRKIPVCERPIVSLPNFYIELKARPLLTIAWLFCHSLACFLFNGFFNPASGNPVRGAYPLYHFFWLDDLYHGWYQGTTIFFLFVPALFRSTCVFLVSRCPCIASFLSIWQSDRLSGCNSCVLIFFSRSCRLYYGTVCFRIMPLCWVSSSVWLPLKRLVLSLPHLVLLLIPHTSD